MLRKQVAISLAILKDLRYIFYRPDRHTKFTEMSYTMCLEGGMIKWSIVPREISLDNKRVCTPTPMIFVVHLVVAVLIATTLVGHSNTNVRGLRL
jgi:hypothetical protein